MDAATKDVVGYLVGMDAFANERIPIPRMGMTLGRDPKAASQVLGHAMVSRVHVKVEVTGEGNVVVSDLGSTNGTFVNGKKLTAAATLAAGDKVTLDEAGKLLLVFEPAKAAVGDTTATFSLPPPAAAAVPSPAPAAPSPSAPEAEWINPRKWMAEALKAEGKDLSPATVAGQPAPSLKAQSETDLRIYNEAQRIFEQLIGQGRREFEPQLAALLTDKAVLYETVESFSEAALLLDRAIETYERLVESSGQQELANDLATACSNKAGLVWSMGDHRAALTLCDHVVEIRDWLVNHEGRRELRGDLARAKSKRAVVFMSLGNVTMAQAEAREAVAMLQTEAEKTGREDLRAELEWATQALNQLL